MGDVALTFNSLLDKIEEVVRVTENVAHGDLSKTVEPKSDKDILGHAVNRMVTGLRNFVSQIENVSYSITDSVRELETSRLVHHCFCMPAKRFDFFWLCTSLQ